MRSTQKKYRSSAGSRYPPITPGTLGSKTRNAARAPSLASTIPRSSLPPPSSSGAVTRQLRTPYPTADTPNEAEQYNSAEDDLGHVIAAIDIKDYGTVGCAYYSAEEEKLYLFGDTRSGGVETIDACAFDLLDSQLSSPLTFKPVILQIKPTIILTPSRVEIPSVRGREQSLAQDNGITYRTYMDYGRS